MKKLIGGLTTAFAVGAMALGSISPAVAQSSRERYSGRDREVYNYCQNYSRDRDCRDWRDNRSRWDDRRYQNFYGNRRNQFPNAAAGIFGFAAGAILGGALANQNNNNNRGNSVVIDSSHVARCEARFRSYDRRSDTYLGFDGNRHYCQL